MLNGLTVFSTKSCIPCRQLKTRLDEAGVKYNVIDLGDEANEHYKFKYNLRSVPTVAMMDNDLLDWTLVGDKAKVETILERIAE